MLIDLESIAMEYYFTSSEHMVRVVVNYVIKEEGEEGVLGDAITGMFVEEGEDMSRFESFLEYCTQEGILIRESRGKSKGISWRNTHYAFDDEQTIYFYKFGQKLSKQK